jgi:CHAD domain-containing protein
VEVRATIDHERKLDAPIGFTLPELGGSPLEPRLFTSVYYDTPSGSLAASGITLRRRTEHGRSLWQLKLPADDARLELELEGGPAHAPEKVEDLLFAHLRRGDLAPVAELRTRRRGELVARNGTTAEVTVDEVEVMDANRVRDRFVEVEVELRTGRPGYLDVLVGELSSAGAQPGAGVPKLFRALGREPEEGRDDQTPLERLRMRLREQLREVERHDPGTRLGQDPESLHDMRVAIRRLRAALRTGCPLLLTDMRELDGRLRELGSALGEVRDLDVLLQRLRDEAAALDAPDAAPAKSLLTTLPRERAGKRRRLLGLLRSDAYLALLDDTAAAIDSLEASNSKRSLDDLAAKASRKLRKAVGALPADPSDDDLHRLRKTLKRARYAAELAGNTAMVARAKPLQDTLGEHQDAVVASHRLRELATSAPGKQALAAGRLIEREAERRASARAQWPKAWKRLSKAL